MDSRLENKPLLGHRVGISISAGDKAELTRHGFDDQEVNRVVRTIAQVLLSQGAKLAFGHDWRPDSVMTEVLRLAQNFRVDSGRRSSDDAGEAVITNFVAWPDEPYADRAELQNLRGVLSVVQTGLPELMSGAASDFSRRSVADADSEKLYLRVRSLSEMRRQLTKISTARVCIGGKLAGSSGRFPGITEEAMFALQAGQPLYLSGMLGGATSHLIQAVRRDGTMPKDFAATNDKVAKSFAERARTSVGKVLSDDNSLDSQRIWDLFSKTGVRGLAAINGLSVQENEHLFDAVTSGEVSLLIASGLSRVKQKAS